MLTPEQKEALQTAKAADIPIEDSAYIYIAMMTNCNASSGQKGPLQCSGEACKGWRLETMSSEFTMPVLPASLVAKYHEASSNNACKLLGSTCLHSPLMTRQQV